MKKRHMDVVAFVFVFVLIHSLQPQAEAEAEAEAEAQVLELDDSNFEKTISTFDLVFVDFYAPWCGHCNRLSPELDEAAPLLAALKEPILIAKLNADKFPSLAHKYDVQAYPTLMLFTNGIPAEYHGPRKADLLVRYLSKFAASHVSILHSDSAIHEFLEAAGNFFPIYIGFGFNNSMFDKLALKYKKNAWFSVAKDFSEDAMVLYDFDKVPALVSINPTYNERSTFYGPFEEEFLEDFVKQNLIPLAVPVSHDTLKLMSDDGRKIALTIVEDENEDKTKELIKLLKAAASANRDLIFSYVGIAQSEEFAEKFDINTELPKMVIWDGSDDYLIVVGSESINGEDQATQITKLMEGYREGKTLQKRISGPSLLKAMHRSFDIRMVYIFVFVVAVMMLIQTLYKGDNDYERAPNQDQGNNARSSVFEGQNKEYKPGDKQD